MSEVIQDQKENEIKFHCPLNITKAKNDKGEEVMRLAGIASTKDEDSDGEYLDPSGFIIDDFLKIGFVNWHHLPSEKPKTIIGEPTKAEITKKGFYIETELYPSSQMAKDVYELAETLKKDSKTRRLGFSIEGSVLERGSENENHPDYKKIKKANITGVAVTFMPKNTKTFAEIIKACKDGEIKKDEDPCWEGYEQQGMKEKDGKKVPNCVKKDKDEESEKSLSTTSGAALTKESLDGVDNKKVKNAVEMEKSNYKVPEFGYEEQYDLIFDAFPNITINKSEKINTFLNQIKTTMDNNKETVTDDQLQKAFSQLGFDSLDTNPFLEKSKKGKMSAEEAAKKVEKETLSDDEEDMKKYKKLINQEGESKKEVDGDPEDDEDEHEEEKGKKRKGEPKKGIKKSSQDELGKGAVLILKKAIESSKKSSFKNSKALATMVKASMERNEELSKENAELKKSISKIEKSLSDTKENLEEYLDQPVGRKSMRKARPTEKESFKKSNGSDGKVLSKSQNFREVLELLDNRSFANGGYDEDFAKATTTFESSKVLPQNIISRIKSEIGVEIVE